MKTILSLLIITVAICGFAGCSRDRSVNVTIQAQNPGLLAVACTPTRLDERWFIAQLALTNVSSAPITLTNFKVEDNYPTFTFTRDGGIPVSAVFYSCSTPTDTNREQLTTLTPGVTVNVLMKWRLVGSPAKNTPWTLTLGGFVHEGKPLRDLVIHNAVEM